MEAAGVGGGVVVLEGDVGADDGEIAEGAAEGRRFRGGGSAAGAKHELDGFPGESNDLLLDQDESLLRLVIKGFGGFDVAAREVHVIGGHL